MDKVRSTVRTTMRGHTSGGYPLWGYRTCEGTAGVPAKRPRCPDSAQMSLSMCQVALDLFRGTREGKTAQVKPFSAVPLW